MTRPLPKRTTRRVKCNALFPDADEVLARGERVKVAGGCEVCGCTVSRTTLALTYEGRVCVDIKGCWDRHEKARRVR